jgi:hypothetical protein
VDNALCETCRFHRFPIAIGTAEAIYVLFLDKKNQKSSNQIGFFCRTGLGSMAYACLCAAKSGNPDSYRDWAGSLSWLSALTQCAMKIPLALPLHTVLHRFA